MRHFERYAALLSGRVKLANSVLVLGTAIATATVLILPESRRAIQLIHESGLSGLAANQETSLNGGVELILQAQKRVPEGERIITKIGKPFLFDFLKNSIYVIDWPHGSSLPPGMPYQEGGEALARYFVSRSIKFIIFDHGVEGDAWYPGGDDVRCRDQVQAAEVIKQSGGGTFAWECAMDLVTADFKRNLIELMKSGRNTYDNGEIVVLELGDGQ
jgi:hypothetical protein